MNGFPSAPAWVILSVCLVCCFGNAKSGAAQLRQARVTRVIRDVRLLAPSAEAVKAELNQAIGDGTAIRTGVDSRAEIAFDGQSLVRSGANTLFLVRKGTRDLDLEEGAILFSVPLGISGPTIKTGALTVEIAGTTGIIERHGGEYVKILLLQGEGRAYLRRIGESVLIQAGQLLITKPQAESLPEPVNYDIGQLYKTSLLTNLDFAPLQSKSLIDQEIEKQKSDPNFIPTNLVIFGRGTVVNLVEPTPSSAGSADPTASPSPARLSPGKSKRKL